MTDDEKECGKCGDILPATRVWFYRCGATHDGLQCYCKRCRNMLAKQYSRVNNLRYRYRMKARKLLLDGRMTRYRIFNPFVIVDGPT